MINNCEKCKCNTCSLMYNCEVIMEKIIKNDHTKTNQCQVILRCDMYESKLDPSIRKVWECEAKKYVKGEV